MRLIDADALIKHLDDAIQDAKSNGEICDYWEDDRSNLLYYLDTAPSVDAVEVVLCKDCKHVTTDATCCLVCGRSGMGLKPYHVYHDDFCSYGERRTE